MADIQLTLFASDDNPKSKRPSRAGDKNSNWKGGKIRLSCQRCGTPFDVIPSRAGKARFCTLTCFNEYQKETPCNTGRRKEYIEIACRQCESLFEVPPSHVGLRYFCCRKCHMAWRRERMKLEKNPRWEGGIARLPYAPEWPYARAVVRERDGDACLNPLCKGKSTNLVVHHIDYDKMNCDLVNLITVCDVCNSEANRHRKKWMLHYQAIQQGRGIYSASVLRTTPAWPDPPDRKGSKHPMAKLNEDDIAEILRCKANGVRNRRLAERFNVSEASISLIVNGKSWTHLPREESS